MNLYIQMGFSHVRLKTEIIPMGDEGPIWHFQPHFFAIGGFRIHHWGNSTRIHGKPSGGKPFRNEDFLKDGIGLVVFHQVEKDPFFDQQDRDSFP
jgi:hypothetical protein